MSFERCDKALIDKYISETDALIKEIESSPTTVEITGTKYYVAANGSDENDGLTPETPWKTISKVNTTWLKYGDGVFFKRGDEFRTECTLETQIGVTYSAYGNGKKPRLIASIDGSGAEKWLPTEYDNIYLFDGQFTFENNVGNIIFDNGRAWGIQIQKTRQGTRHDIGRVFNGLEWFETTKGEFKDYGTLDNNLEYYNDMDAGKLYLYCKDGNPGDVFKSIEIATRKNCISLKGYFDVVIDNLDIFGAGCHGIAGGTMENVTVQYCTLKWIGGAIQGMYIFGRDHGTRLGNAVESYGNSNGFVIHHCYASQVYDCCWTVQFSKSAVMRNVKMYDNVTEYCNTGLEVWQSGGLIENMELYHNYTRFNGYGWSHQRVNKDANFFYGASALANVYKNCSVHDNINYLSQNYALLARPAGPRQYNFNHNVYIMEEGTYIGGLAQDPATSEGPWTDYEYNKENIERFQSGGFEPGSKYYICEKAPYADDMYTLYLNRK